MKGTQSAGLFLLVALVLLAVICVPRLGASWYVNQSMLYSVQWFDQDRGSLAERHHLGNQAYRYLQSALSLDPARLDERLSTYLACLEVFEARAGRRAEVLAADELLAAGRALEVSRQTEQAVVAYQSSVALNPRLVEAYAGLYRGYSMLALHKEARAALSKLESLEPAHRLGQCLSDGRCDESRSVEVLSGWRLLGYELHDAEEVAYLRSVRVTLYWEMDTLCGEGMRELIGDVWHWYAIGKRVYQVGAITNLISNAGFEGLVLGNKRLSIPGWPNDWYTTTPSQIIDVPRVQRDGSPSSVLRLTNVAGGPSAKRTGPLRLDLPGPYLLAGWLYVEGGSTGCIGRHWYPALGGGPELEYLTCVNSSSPGWSHAADLSYPAPNAEWFTVILKNLGPGQVLFDDILFAPLELPRAIREKLPCAMQ